MKTLDLANLKVKANGLSAKEVIIEVTAINPVDGKEYTRSAGWLSLTNTLHAGSKTPAYIMEAASRLMFENKTVICQFLETIALELNDTYNIAERRKHWGRQEIEIGSHHERKGHMTNKDFWINRKRTAGI